MKVPADKERLEREIDATDKQIDELVYELYGLTDEEIKIVETGSPVAYPKQQLLGGREENMDEELK